MGWDAVAGRQPSYSAGSTPPPQFSPAVTVVRKSSALPPSSCWVVRQTTRSPRGRATGCDFTPSIPSVRSPARMLPAESRRRRRGSGTPQRQQSVRHVRRVGQAQPRRVVRLWHLVSPRSCVGRRSCGPSVGLSGSEPKTGAREALGRQQIPFHQHGDTDSTSPMLSNP